MLQKYAARNDKKEKFIAPLNVINFDKKIRARESETNRSNVELPAMASAGDLREIVRFLSRENASVRISELGIAEPRRVFETEKLAAYEAWGIIKREANSIRLSDLGLELAKRNCFEREIYRQILSNLPPYLNAVKWMNEQNLKVINFGDLADFWETEFPELSLDKLDTKEIETVAQSFFSICHAAEFGIMTIGKRGQPTRLSLNVQEIENFFGKNSGAPERFSGTETKNKFVRESLKENESSKVYISIGKRKSLGNLIELLKLTDFEVQTAFDVSLKNNLFDPSQIYLMKICGYGLFILDRTHCDEQPNGNLKLRNEKLIEINAAFALFGEKIILFWDDEGVPPPEIANTGLMTIIKRDSDWETNLQIAKTLKEFV